MIFKRIVWLCVAAVLAVFLVFPKALAIFICLTTITCVGWRRQIAICDCVLSSFCPLAMLRCHQMLVDVALLTAFIVTNFAVKFRGEFWRVFVIHLSPKERTEKSPRFWPKLFFQKLCSQFLRYFFGEPEHYDLRCHFATSFSRLFRDFLFWTFLKMSKMQNPNTFMFETL